MTARHLLSLAALAALSATTTLPARAQTAFVSSEKDHKLTVVDLKTQAVTGTIATCKRPRHMVLMPDGRTLFAVWTIGHGGALGSLFCQPARDFKSASEVVR